MKHTITSKKAYHETMVTVYELINKGEANLTEKELNKLETMAIAAEEYEDNVLGLKPVHEPETKNLLSTKANREHLMSSIDQLNNGKGKAIKASDLWK